MLQEDGNLVVRDGSGSVLWASNRRLHDRQRDSHRSAGGTHAARTYGVLEDNGNLVVYAAEEVAGEVDCLWASVKCPERPLDLPGTVKAVRNSLRLSVRAVRAAYRDASPLGDAPRPFGSAQRGPEWLSGLFKFLRGRQ